MAITASVAFFKNEFVAVLSNAIEYEWHAGQRMITAGQQVALRAEIQRLGHTPVSRIVAA